MAKLSEVLFEDPDTEVAWENPQQARINRIVEITEARGRILDVELENEYLKAKLDSRLNWCVIWAAIATGLFLGELFGVFNR